ncbi:tyrosine-type recombinase/integrase [Desulfovibrio sp.]|uniref:tyrosine-type recombinase/integrase n=1 Tax=Desulfovibrio sp. TaxID=885 RepID=UPI0035AE5CE5
MLAQGIDPAQEKREQRDALISENRDTFKAIALELHGSQTVDFTEKHRQTMLFRLQTYLLPVLGNKTIKRIEPQDILAIVKPIEARGQNETARRLMQIMGQIFRYAVVTGRAKQNITGDMRGVLRPRRVTHRAAITDQRKVGPLLTKGEDCLFTLGERTYYEAILKCALRGICEDNSTTKGGIYN